MIFEIIDIGTTNTLASYATEEEALKAASEGLVIVAFNEEGRIICGIEKDF